MSLPEDDGVAALDILWAYCVEYHGDVPGRVIGFLDEQWRWGTDINPDRRTLEDPTVPMSAADRQRASKMSGFGGAQRRRP